MIVPWFGPLPDWFPRYVENVRTLAPDYGFLFDFDLPAFKQRVEERLGITDAPLVEGGSKIHDYRPAFGELYARELEGYDWWGHTDLDCVYGRVQRFWGDDYLAGLDVYSNHTHYVCGPWTLYRNSALTAHLFRRHPDWRAIMEQPETTGWVETGFTEVVDEAHALGHLERRYELQHVFEAQVLARLRWGSDGAMMLGENEKPMCHFRRTKAWPAGLA